MSKLSILALAASLLSTTSALAYDPKEKGSEIRWQGICHTLRVAEVFAPFCHNTLRMWISYDEARYNFTTRMKQSETDDITTYEFIGSHSFIGAKGEMDTFMIDEIWVTKRVSGKDQITKEKATGKCITFLENENKTIHLDCNIKGAKTSSIQYKFSGDRITKEENEPNEKKGAQTERRI